MAIKQTVAIIGATGNMGSAIAKSLAKGPYRFLLMTKSVEKLRKLVQEMRTALPEVEMESISCPKDACWEADLIVFAVPYSAEAEIAEQIKPYTTGKVVVSISKPTSEVPESSAAEELQRKLPYSKVVKVFSTVVVADFENTLTNPFQDVLLAGNDQEALEIVSALVKNAGFNAVLSGDLAASKTLENIINKI